MKHYKTIKTLKTVKHRVHSAFVWCSVYTTLVLQQAIILASGFGDPLWEWAVACTLSTKTLFYVVIDNIILKALIVYVWLLWEYFYEWLLNEARTGGARRQTGVCARLPCVWWRKSVLAMVVEKECICHGGVRILWQKRGLLHRFACMVEKQGFLHRFYF